MLTIVIVSVVMVVSLFFTYSNVALSASIRNEGTLPICHRAFSPFAEEETSIETSELKIVKSLYIWLLPRSKALVSKNLHLREDNMSKTFPAPSRWLPRLFDY
jgi:hypothetical protein